MQEGMLFEHLTKPLNGGVIRRTISLSGPLSLDALKKAWEMTVMRHSALRTLFSWEGKTPVQVLQKQFELPFACYDVRQLSAKAQNSRIASYLEQQVTQGFSLTEGLLFRIGIFQTSDETSELIFSIHHLVVDAQSVQTVLYDVFRFYGDIVKDHRAMAMPAPSYQGYIDWLQRRDLTSSKKFWSENLKGLKPQAALPAKFFEESERKDMPYISSEPFRLSDDDTVQLKSLMASHNVTVNQVIRGAWAILLNRYGRESDVTYGMVVSCRPQDFANANLLVGLCVNTVPFRVQVDPEMQVHKWLQKTGKEWGEIMNSHYLCPPAEIKKCCELPGDQPLYESAISFHRLDEVPNEVERIGNLEIRHNHSSDQLGAAHTEFPVVLHVIPGAGFAARIDYHTARFDKLFIERMAGHLQTLIVEICANPEAKLADLNLLTRAEKKIIVNDWNDTPVKYKDGEKCLHEIIEHNVLSIPQEVAVTFGSEHITFLELNKRSNQLANFLIAEGTGPGKLVGVCMNRSIEMVVALLGIMKAGGAYVPMDPEYPKQRLQFMIGDINSSILISQQELAQLIPENKSKRLYLDSEWSRVSGYSEENPVNRAGLQDIAYGIFTSGSTGNPKCALNTHAGIVNRLLWMQNEYRLDRTDCVLQKTPFSFDVSVWEFFWPLMTGARLVMARPGGHRDPSYLSEVICQEKVTTIHFVPSMLRLFVESSEIKKCKPLKRVICSGEALPYDLQQMFFSSCHSELHNLYGPTEASVDVSYWACSRDYHRKIVPIGKPIANVQLYILDPFQLPVPVGIPGELHIGGVALAEGYRNRPELTAEKFIANPMSSSPGSRLYKTGDLCRFLPDGNIEYLGRLDHQVKIRGLRIELGEIELALCEHSAIKNATVVAHSTANREAQLVAYIVLREGESLNRDRLQTELESKLPKFMVPSIFMVLEAMPLSPNGKVDRKVLPSPETSTRADNSFSAPLGETAQVLAAIWQGVLGCSPIGLFDNYFSLGGDSMRSIQIAMAARKLGLAISPLDVLQFPTIDALAKKVASASLDHAGGPPNVSLISVPREQLEYVPKNAEDIYPVTGMQDLIIRQFSADERREGIYHFQKVFTVEDKQLSLSNLRQAVSLMIARHPVFRTMFVHAKSGEYLQVLLSALDEKQRANALLSHDLRNLSVKEQDSYIENYVNEDRIKGFAIDLGELPYRFIFFQKSESEVGVLFSCHHAICDGWGNIEFNNDMFAAYLELRNGGRPSADSSVNTFKEYVALERETLLEKQSDRFWKDYLKDSDATVIAKKRGVSLVGPYEPVTLQLPAFDQLRLLARDLGISLKSVFLSAYFDLIGQESRQASPIVGVLCNGRKGRLTDPLKAQGLFWNFVPLYCKLEPDNKRLQAQAVQKTLISTEPFSDIPLPAITKNLKTDLFFASFNFTYFHNTRAIGREEDELKVSVRFFSDKHHFPLNMRVIVDPFGGGARLRIEYDKFYFSVSDIQKMTSKYIEFLGMYI